MFREDLQKQKYDQVAHFTHVMKSNPIILDMQHRITDTRGEIDNLMTEKLQELTPEKVKQLMEEVIRTHLGWLIVWGNVFGGLIGLVSTMAGYP